MGRADRDCWCGRSGLGCRGGGARHRAHLEQKAKTGFRKRLDTLHRRLDYTSQFALTARVLTASVALTARFFVYQTARRGGELVYAHGVGVKSAPAQTSGKTAAEND